ncbi:alpha-amylase [Spirochaetia bacterium]|nr:alpha-amylase [Spirochaetia bacterium]
MNPWWKEGPVYQIYPRSFQDSNGDGLGDIPGIISRLDELAELGIRGIWLSPVYSSPGIDNGYDISDYRAIDPRLGTMEDMEALIREAANRDIRIIMDLVINHTSDEHEWFQKSRNREAPYDGYYIWRPAKPTGGPPNNWTGFFMERTWTWDEQRGEYYLHLFHKKQPDLNYRNPRVIEEIKGILRFWLDKGVGGFRCDVINLLYKTSLEDGRQTLILRGLEHYKSQEGNHAVLRELRREVLDKYDCFTVGETVMVDLDEAKLLSDTARRELDMVFYFDHLEVDRRISRFVPRKFRAGKLLEVLTTWQQGLDWNAVYLENHDQSRIVSHYGDDSPAYWERSAKLLSTLEFTLRGTPFIYQGQEIGMTNFDFTGPDQVRDIESHNLNRLMHKLGIPAWLRWKWIRPSSRDNARTPYQWSAAPGAGFTQGVPWLGINANHRRINHEAQRRDPASVLSYYQGMIRFRQGSETLKYGSFKPLPVKGNLIAYEREGEQGEKFTIALNFSGRPVKAAFPGTIVASNIGRREQDGVMEPWEALVVLCKPPQGLSKPPPPPLSDA